MKTGKGSRPRAYPQPHRLPGRRSRSLNGGLGKSQRGSLPSPVLLQTRPHGRNGSAAKTPPLISVGGSRGAVVRFLGPADLTWTGVCVSCSRCHLRSIRHHARGQIFSPSKPENHRTPRSNVNTKPPPFAHPPQHPFIRIQSVRQHVRSTLVPRLCPSLPLPRPRTTCAVRISCLLCFDVN